MLATAVRDAVALRKQCNEIVIKPFVQVRRRDLTLKYHDDFGFANLAPERVEGDSWDWQDQAQFQKTVLENLPEYRSLATSVGTKAHLLEVFVRITSFLSFHGLADTDLSERVTALARELGDQPLPVRVTAFLSGVSILKSPVVVERHGILRKPEPDDVTECIRMDDYGGVSFPLTEAWLTIVGDLTFEALSTGFAQKEFYRTLDAL